MLVIAWYPAISGTVQDECSTVCDKDSLSQTVLHSPYNCKYFSAENVTNFSSLFPDLTCSHSSVLSGKSSPKSSPSNSGSHSGQKFCSINFLDFIKLFWAQQRMLVLFLVDLLAPGFPLCRGAGLRHSLCLSVCAVLAVFRLVLVSVSSLFVVQLFVFEILF